MQMQTFVLESWKATLLYMCHKEFTKIPGTAADLSIFILKAGECSYNLQRYTPNPKMG